VGGLVVTLKERGERGGRAIVAKPRRRTKNRPPVNLIPEKERRGYDADGQEPQAVRRERRGVLGADNHRKR